MSKRPFLARLGRFWWLWILFACCSFHIGYSLAFGKWIVRLVIQLLIVIPLMWLGSFFYVKSLKSDNENQIGLKPFRNVLLPWPRSAVLLMVSVLIELLVSIPLFAYNFYPCSGLDLIRKTNGCVAVIPHNESVVDIAFSSSGSRLATVDLDGAVKVWSYPDMILQSSFEGDWQGLGHVALTSDGDLVAFSGYGGSAVNIGKTSTGEILYTLPHDSESGGEVVFSSSSDLLISLAESSVQIWDFDSGELVYSLPQDNVDSLAMTPDGSLLVSANWGGQIKVWRLADRENIITLEQPFLQAIAVSPDGRYIIAAVWDLEGVTTPGDEPDTLLNYWGIESGSIEHTVIQQDVHITNIAISHDGTNLVDDTGSSFTSSPFDRVCAYVWRVENGDEPMPLQVPASVASLAFSPTTDELVVGSHLDLYIWQIP